MKDPMLIDRKINALKEHLDVVDDPAGKLKYIMEKVGERIDKESAAVTKGILAGLSLPELKSVWNLLAHDLFEVESLQKAGKQDVKADQDPSEHTKKDTPKKKNVRSRKASR